jgi:DNA-binding CsgD family transcriptional regulator
MAIQVVDGPLRLPCPLTPLQREIVYHYAQGLIGKEVAKTIFRSENTVKSHTYKVRRQLGAKNTAHMVYIATKNGWI